VSQQTSAADREITDRLLRIESDVSKLTITPNADALAIAQLRAPAAHDKTAPYLSRAAFVKPPWM
jgi:hypothetical protein